MSGHLSLSSNMPSLSVSGIGQPSYLATPGTVGHLSLLSNYGCPEDVKTKLTYIAKNIYFHVDKATLQDISFEPLNQLADILTRYPNAKLTIEGHTDNTGSNAHNLTLSNNRAKAVVDYLVSKGIDASRLTAVGFGEEKPVTTNKTAEGRTLNRRVELKLDEN